jgi:hypothetical protein
VFNLSISHPFIPGIYHSPVPVGKISAGKRAQIGEWGILITIFKVDKARPLKKKWL